MKIALELSVEEAELLSSTAVRLGIRPEELARATIADALSQDKEAFRKAAEYVVEMQRAKRQLEAEAVEAIVEWRLRGVVADLAGTQITDAGPVISRGSTNSTHCPLAGPKSRTLG